MKNNPARRAFNVNIALGLIGCCVFIVTALVAASRHDTTVSILLSIFANIFVIKTVELYRRRKSMR